MRHFMLVAVVCAIPAYSLAAIVAETEANDSKATANAVALTAVGDGLSGVSTGSSTSTAGIGSADYFLLSLPAQPSGIYRNRMTITTNGTAGHTGSIRGLTQSATGTNSTGPGTINAGTDSTIGSSSSSTTPARYNQFYTFGRPTSLHYRVAGTTATTVDYTSTWSQDPVTPAPLGSFREGTFVFTNLGLASTTDTEVFVYDSNFNIVGTNDDTLDVANGGPAVPAGSSTLNSYLSVNLTPGTYYLALSNFNTAASVASGANEGTATGGVLDFADVLTNSSTTTIASFPFAITNVDGTSSITATKPGAFDVFWGSLTVTAIPEPTTLATALGVSFLLRRRR